MLPTFKPTCDAVAVARVKDAGAIVFGKTNLVEMSYRMTGPVSSYIFPGPIPGRVIIRPPQSEFLSIPIGWHLHEVAGI